MWKADSFEKTLMLGKIEGRRRGRQRMRWLDGITDSMDMGLVDSGSWWRTGRPGVLWFTGLQRVGHNWATELNWTECQTFSNSFKKEGERKLSNSFYEASIILMPKPQRKINLIQKPQEKKFISQYTSQKKTNTAWFHVNLVATTVKIIEYKCEVRIVKGQADGQIGNY